jgi:uncharacterized protein YaiL (DUF2058 family)
MNLANNNRPNIEQEFYIDMEHTSFDELTIKHWQIQKSIYLKIAMVNRDKYYNLVYIEEVKKITVEDLKWKTNTRISSHPVVHRE